MGATSFPTTEPLVLDQRADYWFPYTMQLYRLAALLGDTPNHIGHVNVDLTKKAGETIYFAGGNPLSEGGKGDDGDTGTGEAMGQRNTNITVHENSHSTSSAGPMSQQRMQDFRTIDQFRQQGDRHLAEWRAERIENDSICALAGLYNENSGGADIQTITEIYPTSTRIYFGGQSIGASAALGTRYTTDAGLTAGTQASNYFGRLVVEEVLSLMKTATPRMRPGIFAQPDPAAEGSVAFKTPGEIIGNFFVGLISPHHWKKLRGDSQYADMLAAAENRGRLHPLLTGGNCMWEGCVLTEYDRCPTRTGANGTTLAEGFALNAGRTATSDACANTRSVARSLILGAQAFLFAWAMKPSFAEEMIDANKPKIKQSAIYGVSVARFNYAGTSTPMAEEGRYAIDSEY